MYFNVNDVSRQLPQATMACRDTDFGLADAAGIVWKIYFDRPYWALTTGDFAGFYYTGKIVMPRNTLLVLEVGLLLGFGLTLSAGASNTDLQ